MAPTKSMGMQMEPTKTSKWRQSGSNKCTDETNGISGTLKEALQRQINAHDAEIRAREEANVATGCLNE
jgi:hypothetical protein